eukprot:CAMPEP_0115233264 /NCGR_PEP_ID=MMETSP0270-20121206/34187_1 /TAXON_ID=71861 /ORGANISM="Scrippsiella trochoidea, Strain CCMP3099" /LENGTH=134 /DNA_ID=CAMNT_0002647973 /DNA_START=541 /DNA_END=943 /DNA_ORIENTATION=+
MAIVATTVNNKDQSLCILVVLSPPHPHRATAPYIPHSEGSDLLSTPVGEGLDIKSDSRYQMSYFPRPHLVEHGRLPCESKPTINVFICWRLRKMLGISREAVCPIDKQTLRAVGPQGVDQHWKGGSNHEPNWLE